MITERGAALLIGGAFLWLLGRFLGVQELAVVAAACGGLALAAIAAVWLATGTVAIRRSLAPTRMPWAGSARVRIDLRNDGLWPAGLLLVEDDCPYVLAERPRFTVPGLPRGATVTLEYPLHGASRGRYPIGPVSVRLRDPFGLAERVRRYTGTDAVVVYPRIEVLPAGRTPGMTHGDGGASHRRLLNAGDEFYAIREYHRGDDLRLVHWPSSARRGSLMVRQFERPWEPQATVLCDTRAAVHRGSGPASTFETAVSAAASVIAHLDRHAYRLRLVTGDDREPAEGDDGGRLLDRLAEISPTGRPGLAPVLSRLGSAGAAGMLVAILAPPPAAAGAAAERELTALRAAGRGHRPRLAIVVDTDAPRTATGAADRFTELLRNAGWRAEVLRQGTSLAPVWQALTAAAGARR